MGEVVDLEIYRKRLKRGVARGQGPGSRRGPGHDLQNAQPAGKKTGTGKSRSSKTGRLEATGKTKIESNDSKSD